MYNACTELFLNQYFLLETVFEKMFSEKKKLFFKYGNLFGLSSKDLEKLFENVENSNVTSISSEKEYFRYLRIRKYMRLSSMENRIPAEIEETITIKGNTITQALNAGVKKVSESTATSICNDILAKVKQGSVMAMRLYGIACLEGIGFRKDSDEGIENLEAAASWLDIPSIVLLRHYDKENKFGNDAHLMAALISSSYMELASIYKIDKAGKKRISNTNKLLTKAFDNGILQREVYLPQYARVIFNDGISISDREKLVLSSGKEQVQNVTELPTQLVCVDNIPFDFSAFDGFSSKRDAEKKKIKQNLGNSDLRNHEGYRPLCVVSSSASLLGMFASAITVQSEDANVVYLNVADCSEQDFDMSQNNIFVRNCKADKANIYYVFCVGQLSEKAISSIKDFLTLDKRRSFRLNYPSITLDLGKILPICLCDKQNAKHFKSYCDIVSVAQMNQEEVIAEIKSFVQERETTYGISSIKVNDELLGKFVTMDIDVVKNILDRAILFKRDGNVAIELTLENVSEFMKSSENNIGYGFGGVTDADK